MIETLRAGGFRVEAPVLPGHDPAIGPTMPGSTWREWLDAAESAFDALAASTEPGRVAVVGFSTGATLALALAGRREVARLVLLAPFLAIRFTRLFLVPPALYLRPFSRVFPDIPRRGAAARSRIVRRELAGSSHFRTFSLPSTLSALELIARVTPTVGAIRAPTLILQGRRDSVVEPSRAAWLLARLGSTEKRLLWLPRSDHLLALDRDRAAVLDAVAGFLYYL